MQNPPKTLQTSQTTFYSADCVFSPAVSSGGGEGGEGGSGERQAAENSLTEDMFHDKERERHVLSSAGVDWQTRTESRSTTDIDTRTVKHSVDSHS